MKKYELDKNDSIGVYSNHILYRVVYTDEFIKKYEERYGLTIEKKGGYIESEKNLSQDGYAVVLDNAVVYEDAQVLDNAIVYANARVYSHAEIHDKAEVYENAQVYGNAKIYGNAEIFNKAMLYDDAEVFDNAIVGGNAKLLGNAKVYGSAEIYGNAEISDKARTSYGPDSITVICDDSNNTKSTIAQRKLIIDVYCRYDNSVSDVLMNITTLENELEISEPTIKLESNKLVVTNIVENELPNTSSDTDKVMEESDKEESEE